MWSEIENCAQAQLVKVITLYDHRKDEIQMKLVDGALDLIRVAAHESNRAINFVHRLCARYSFENEHFCFVRFP